MSTYKYSLLIENYKDEILKVIKRSKVCVIKGPTGCGKSTYIPYLLSSSSARIAIVEPRRIAVTSLYNTLSTVMKDVGYKMRFSKMVSKETRTTIYTDGSFLNEIRGNVFDYIIVDEVHERSIRTDVILAILKNDMKKMTSKIILMSATVDTEKIARYFNASVLEVPGVSHPCRTEYLQAAASDYVNEAYCVIKRIVGKNEDVWDGFESKNRDILVFLPGEEDINDLYALLKKLLVIKVHRIFSSLSDKEQNRIYESSDLRKVILSTNICETSLTIPGIGYVVDSGLHKVKIYDGINHLGIQPISKDSAEQRLGRCNRTGPGVCYRLYSKDAYDGLKPQTPEICRSDLSHVFLQLLSHNKNVFELDFLDYPTRSNVINALKFLMRKNCIKVTDKTRNAELHSDNADVDDVRLGITSYGRMVLQHPFDVHLSYFYQQALDMGLGYLASVLLSLISQDNHNFLRSNDKDHKTDIESLVSLFERYMEAEDKKRYCFEHGVPVKGMERAKQMLCRLSKKRGGDIEALERVFSGSYQHNLCRRMEDGSYEHLESGEIVWIHPKSCFFKRKDKFIVFVDIFCTNKTYARIVGRYFKSSAVQG